MHNAGKQSPKSTKSKKPAPQPTTETNLPDDSVTGLDKGEGSYSGTRDYQNSLKSYLETANVEKDARAAAPSDSYDALSMEKAEEKASRPGIKTRRPSK